MLLNQDESAPTATPTATTTRIKSLAQVLFCKGCCCGKTERGLPEVPIDRLKSTWKAGKLNRAVQLTISGCLGPCDLPNVALVLTPEGSTWYGNIAGDAHYDAWIEWAEACSQAGSVVPLPAILEALRFERFAGESE